METHVFLKCSECNIELNGEAGSLRFKNEKYYCTSCFEKYLYTCDICNQEHDSRENFCRTFLGKKYCSDCSEKRLKHCSHCRITLDITDSNVKYHDGEYYHYDCFHERYFICTECGKVTPNDVCCLHENSNLSYCSFCWEHLALSNSENRDNCVEFSTKRVTLDNVTFKHLRDRKCFGIELEIDNDDLDYGAIERDTVFGSKYDGSLNCGSELYSPILQGDIGYHATEKLCKIIKDYSVGKSAGYHVHIDARDIQWRGAKRIWLLYRIFEGVLYTMLPQSRQDNRYCLKSKMNSKRIANISSKDELKELWYSQSCDENEEWSEWHHNTRYHGCNLHSYFYQSTIEIRYHSSTTSFEKVMNWVKINQAIFRYALSHSTEDILALENFDDCNTNYSRIRKLFKTVIGNDTLWKYYKTRFEKFSVDK